MIFPIFIIEWASLKRLTQLSEENNHVATPENTKATKRFAPWALATYRSRPFFPVDRRYQNTRQRKYICKTVFLYFQQWQEQISFFCVAVTKHWRAAGSSVSRLWLKCVVVIRFECSPGLRWDLCLSARFWRALWSCGAWAHQLCVGIDRSESSRECVIAIHTTLAA